MRRPGKIFNSAFRNLFGSRILPARDMRKWIMGKGSIAVHQFRHFRTWRRHGIFFKHLAQSTAVTWTVCVRLRICNAENLHTLEVAAVNLRNAHYEELYAKAKMKLAALYMCSSMRDLKQAENELVEAEYVLSYRPCKRLEMLLSNVKYVHYVLSGQQEPANRELEIHKTLSKELGEDYRSVAQNNLQNCFPAEARFHFSDQMNTMVALIDPRLW